MFNFSTIILQKLTCKLTLYSACKIGLLCVLICYTHGRYLYAQPFPDLHYNLITEKDGLPPAKTITDMLRDKRGFIWTSGQAGLHRFDGYTFKKLKIKGNAIQQVDFDKYCNRAVAVGDSVFWTSSLEGLMRVNYYTGEYQQYPAVKIFSNHYFFESMVKINDRQALIAVEGHLLLLGPKGIENKIPFKNDNRLGSIWQMYRDNAGRVWADAYLNNGLGRIKPDFSGYDTLFSIIDARAFLFSNDNKKIWIPTWGAGFQVAGMGGTALKTVVPFKGAIFLSAEKYINPRLKKTYIVSGFQQGFVLIDSQTNQYKHYDVPAKAGSKETVVLLGEADGTVWLRCDEGVFCLSAQQEPVRNYYFKNVPAVRNGDPHIYTGYLLSETQDHFFVRLYSSGGALLLSKNEQLYQYVPLLKGVPDETPGIINDVAQDRQEQYWAATDKALVLCDRSLNIKKIFPAPESGNHYKSVFLKQLYVLNDSLLLIRGSASMHLFNVIRQKFVLNRVLPEEAATPYKWSNGTILSAWPQDKDAAKIWCTASGGLYRYNIYTNKIEYAADSIGFVNRLSVDKNGDVWIAALQGMMMLDTKKMTLHRFYNLPGAVPMQATGICIDKAGRVWTSSQQGIQGFDPATKEWVQLTVANGALDNSPMDIMGATSDGRVYYGYQGGYAFLDPDNYFGRKQKAVITGIALNQVDFLWNTNKQGEKWVELPFGKGQLSISFAGTAYYPDNINNYYYRLGNGDTSWHYLSSGLVSLVNTAAGNYKLEVAHSPHPVAGATDFLLIRIKPPFYNTIWFYMACFLIAIGWLSYFIRKRMHKVTQRARQEKEQLEHATLLAQYQQKVADMEIALLHSQMNPHFIFNCLNSIKLYVEKEDMQTASRYLSKFSMLVRAILDHSRSDTVTLASELESLQLYLEMEAMRFKEKLSYTITVAPGIDQEYIEIPPMIIQPYVENAIWHGLMQKEEGGSIAIHVNESAKQELIIAVLDNGIGRVAAARLKKERGSTPKSVGMHITQERLSLLNKKHNMKATVEVKDVYSNGVAAGTSVIIKIPIL